MARIVKIDPIDNIDSSQSVAQLSSYLRNSDNNSQLALFVVGNLDELKHINFLISDFNQLDILLILPNDDDTFMKYATKLYPRYISTLSSNHDDIVSVLARMAHRARSRDNYSHNAM